MSKACRSGAVVATLRVVGQRRVDAALGGAGVAARRMHLAQDGDVDAGRPRLDGGAQPGQAAADDDELMMTCLRGHAQLTQTQSAQIPKAMAATPSAMSTALKARRAPAPAKP